MISMIEKQVRSEHVFCSLILSKLGDCRIMTATHFDISYALYLHCTAVKIELNVAGLFVTTCMNCVILIE
jgi:hypothetical protein